MTDKALISADVSVYRQLYGRTERL